MAVQVDQPDPAPMPWREWLDVEERSEDRHELFSGRLVLLQGGTDRHDLTTTTLYDLLSGPFRRRRCGVYPHNRKVVTPAGDGYYPDLLVRCGPRTDDRYEAAPTWVFEVLCPTNSRSEMSAKLRNYTAIPELQGYVVVDPDSRLVEAYVRHEGLWRFLDVTDSTLPVGPVLVDFVEVFARVEELVSFG